MKEEKKGGRKIRIIPFYTLLYDTQSSVDHTVGRCISFTSSA